MTDAQYEAKFQEMQKHIPFIQKVIEKLKVNNDQQGDNPRKAQLQKMEMLHELLTNRAKKLKMETLMKCEGVLIKLHAKIEKHSTFLQNDDPLLKSSGDLKPVTTTSISPATPTQAIKCQPNNEAVASAPASPSPERIVDDEDILPVVIPTERRDSPIEVLNEETRPSSAADKAKDHQQRHHDHQRQRAPHHNQRSSHHQFKDFPKLEEVHKNQITRDGSLERKDALSTPQNVHNPRTATNSYSNSPMAQFPPLSPPHRTAVKDVHLDSSSKSHQTSHKKELPASSMLSKSSSSTSKSNPPQIIQTVKVVITEPLPANIAKQHFPPHHQYRYQQTMQHSPEPREYQRFINNIEILPRSMTPPLAPIRYSPTDEPYNPDESWEAYNQAQKNAKNMSSTGTKTIFSRLGDKVVEDEAISLEAIPLPKPSMPIAIPTPTNTPTPEVLKSPPLSATDINKLLKESGGDQFTADISEIGTRRAKKPEFIESKSSLDFVRRKFAQIAKINSPQTGESAFSPSSVEVKIEEKKISSTTASTSPMPLERLALKYNPHPRQERLQSLSSNDGSECSHQSSTRVGASPNDPRLKLKNHIPLSAALSLPAGVNVLPAINNNDPRLKKLNTESLPKPSNVMSPHPPIPGNVFGVRNDPRLSRQQQFQQQSAATAHLTHQIPGRRMSISHPCISPEEIWDSDPEEPKKMNNDSLPKPSNVLTPAPIPANVFGVRNDPRLSRQQQFKQQSAAAATFEESWDSKSPAASMLQQSPARITSISQPYISPEEIWDSDPEEAKKTNNDSLPKPSNVLTPPPVPANVFGVRNDPRLSRQQQFKQQSTAASQISQQTPIGRLSISQPPATSGENRDSNSPAASTHQQSVARIKSLSQPYVSPEENWDSDPEEYKKIYSTFGGTEVQRQPSASVERPAIVQPIIQRSMCQQIEVLPLATRLYHCTTNPKEIDFDSRPEAPKAVPHQETTTERNPSLGCASYSIPSQHPPASYLTNPYVKRTAVPLTTPPLLPPHPLFIPGTTGAQVPSRFNSALNDNTERMKYFDARQQKPHGPRTYKEHKEARDEFKRRAFESQRKIERKIGYIEAAKRKFSEEKAKKDQEHEKAKSKIEDHLSKLEEKRTGVIKGKDNLKNKDSAKDKDLEKNSPKVVAAESTLDKMYRTQNFNAQFPKATLSFKIPKKPKPSQDTIQETEKKPEDKPLQSFSKSGNKSQEKTDKNEISKKPAGQKTNQSKTIADKSQKLRVDSPKLGDNKESKEHVGELEDTSIQKNTNIRDPRCKMKESQELSLKDKKAPESSKVEKANKNAKDDTDETKTNFLLHKKNVESAKTKKDAEERKIDFKFDAKNSSDNGNSLNAFSTVNPEFKPQRILRRRCTMVAIGSEPLVDKDTLMKANALMLEDIEEREKLKRKKEEEERQKARRNKHLSEMFQKTDDNCSVSTQNIITGKRSTRASINFNETQNALKIFKHMTMKDTSGTTPLISPAATTKSSKRIRPTRTSGDISTSTDEEENSHLHNVGDPVTDNSVDAKKDSNKKNQAASDDVNSQSNVGKIKNSSKIASDKDKSVENDKGGMVTEKLMLSGEDTKDKDDKSLHSKNNVKDKQAQSDDISDINNVLNNSKKQEPVLVNPSKTKPVIKKGNKKVSIGANKKEAEDIKKLTEDKNQDNIPEQIVSPSAKALAEPTDPTVLGAKEIPSKSKTDSSNSSKPLEEEHQNCAVSSTSAEILPIDEAPTTSKAAQRLKVEADDNEPSSTGSKSSNPTPTPVDDETSRHVFLNEFVQEIIKPNADKQHILSLLSQILSEDKLQFIKTVIDSSNKNEDKETEEGPDETIGKKGEIPIESHNKSKETEKFAKNEEESDVEDEDVARDNEENNSDGSYRLRSKKIVRRKRNELDRLNEDIRDMFICEGVLTATGKRMCTLMQSNGKKDVESVTPGNKIASQSTSPPEFKTVDDTICSVKRKTGRTRKLLPQPLRRSLRACKNSETSINDSVNDDEVEVTTYNCLEKSTNSDATPTRKKMPVLKAHTPIKLPEELDIKVSADPGSSKRKSITKPCPKSKKAKALKADEQTDDIETSSDSQTDSDSDAVEEEGNFSNLETMQNTNVHWHNQSKYTSWCALCSKKILPISSSFHYKLHHGENFISRLAPVLLQKFKQGKLSQPLFGVDRSPKQASWFYRCPFCLQYFNTPMPLWLEHFQNHTAEFRYECSKCHWGSNRIATTRRHMSSNCKGAKIVNSTVKLLKPSEIKAHVCHLCNFVQLKRANLERHYVEQHQLAIKNVDILGYTITLFDFEQVDLVPEDKAQAKEEEIRKQIEVQERTIELEDDKDDEGVENDGATDTLEEEVLKVKDKKSDGDDKEKSLTPHDTGKSEKTTDTGESNSSQQTKDHSVMLERSKVTNANVGPKQTDVSPMKLIKPQTTQEETFAGTKETDKSSQDAPIIGDSVESEKNGNDGTTEQISQETVVFAKKDNEIDVKENAEKLAAPKKLHGKEDKLSQLDKSANAIPQNKHSLSNESKQSTVKPNQSKKTIATTKTAPQPKKTVQTTTEDKNKKTEVLKPEITIDLNEQVAKATPQNKVPTEEVKEPETKTTPKEGTGNKTPHNKSLGKDVSMTEVRLSEPLKEVTSVPQKKTLSDIYKESALKSQQTDNAVKATPPKIQQSEGVKDPLSLEEKLITATPPNNTKSEECTQSKHGSTLSASKETAMVIHIEKTSSGNLNPSDVELAQSTKPTPKKAAPCKEPTKEEAQLKLLLIEDELKSSTTTTQSSKETIIAEKDKSEKDVSPPTGVLTTTPNKKLPKEDANQVLAEKTVAIATPTKKLTTVDVDQPQVSLHQSANETNVIAEKNISSGDANPPEKFIIAAESTTSSNLNPKDISNTNKSTSNTVVLRKDENQSKVKILSPKFNAGLVTATYSKKKAVSVDNIPAISTQHTKESDLEKPQASIFLTQPEESKDDCVIVNSDVSYRYLQDELLTLAAQVAEEEEKEESESITLDTLEVYPESEFNTPDPLEICPENRSNTPNTLEISLSHSSDNQPRNETVRSNTKMSDLISNSIDMFYQRSKRKSDDTENQSLTKKICLNQNSMPATPNAFIPTTMLGGTDSPPIQILAQSIISIDPLEANDSDVAHKPQTISIAERLSQRFKILQDKTKDLNSDSKSKEKDNDTNSCSIVMHKLNMDNKISTNTEESSKKSETKKSLPVVGEVTVISDDEDWEDIEITESAPNPVPSNNIQKAKNKGLFQKFGLFKGNSTKSKKNMPPLVFMPKKKMKDNKPSTSSPITMKLSSGDKLNTPTVSAPAVHLGFKPVINNIEDLLPDSPCNDPIDLVPELTPLEPLTDLNDISSILDSNLSLNMDESHTCIQDALDFISEQQAHEQQSGKPSSNAGKAQVQTKFHKNKIQHVGYSLHSQATNNVKFYCLLENCSFLFSSDAVGLENHFLCEHSQTKWNGFCCMCQTQCENDKEYSIVNEIKHMVDCHVSGTSVVETNSNDSSQHSTTLNQAAEDRPRIKLRRMTGDCLSTSNSESSTPSAGIVAAPVVSSVSSVGGPSISNTLLGALLSAKQKPPTKEMPPQPEMPLTEPLLMDNNKSTAFTNFGTDFHITSVCSGVDSSIPVVQKESSLQIANVMSLNKAPEEPTGSVVPQTKSALSAKTVGNIWSQQIEQEKQDLLESAAASLEVSAILANAGRPSIRREASRSHDDSPGPVLVSETVPVTQEKRGDFVITQTISTQYDDSSTAVGFNISIEVPPTPLLIASNTTAYTSTTSERAIPSAAGSRNTSPLISLPPASSNYSQICDTNDADSRNSLAGFNISNTSPVDSTVDTPPITSRQYKCMAQGCKFTTRVPVAMSDHLRFHERRNFSNNRDYFDCAFCKYQADEVDDYMKHSDEYHIICKANKLIGASAIDADATTSLSSLRGNICDILSKKMETTAQRHLHVFREAQRTSLIKKKESEQEYLRKLKTTIEEIVGGTGFSDDKLYRCVIKNCPTKLTEATFHNHIMYHISTLGITNPNNYVFKCPHCIAQYHRPAGIKAHIKNHARNRYFCYMCDVTSANPGQMMKHFSETHWHTMNMYTKELLKPKVSLSADGSEKIYDSGYYITYSSELSEAEVRKYGEKLILEWQRKKSGSKTHFKSSEIDLLPIQPIFQREVNCGECEYKTKVRTNMYRHLTMHKQYAQQPHTTKHTLVSSVDPVNPVPCLNSNERFFDKMTNLASSSLIPSISGNAASTKAAYKLPHAFISDENRHKCGVPSCTYITISEDIFRSHLALIHSAAVIFRCPFCQEEICKRGVSVDRVINHLRFHSSILYRCDECNYVHHLRFVVERHVNDKHATMKVNIIRHERTDEVGEGTMTMISFTGKKYKEPTDANQQQSISTSSSTAANATRSSSNADATTKSSNSSSTAIAKSKAKWKCDLCNHMASSLALIQLHCQNTHGQNKQYQCMHCNFGSQQLSQILYHIDEKHSGKTREARNIYHKVINSNEIDVADTRPLWQRNDPTRVRHIRGILMEDEEESEKYRKKMGLDKVVDDDEEEEDSDKAASNESNLTNFLKGYEFGCFHCDYKTQQLDELSSTHHKATHSELQETSKPFMFRLLRRVCCPECRKFTGNFYELQLHLLNTHNVRSYYAADLSVAESDDASQKLVCGYCTYQCLKLEQLIKHFQNPKVQHSPQDVHIENDTQMIDLLAMGSKQTYFRCTLCAELLPNRVAIVHHATNMHDNEEGFSFRELSDTLIYHCALCSYTATTESVLLRHMIDHYGRFKRCHFCHEPQVSFEGYMQHCYAEHREDIRKFRELYQYKEIRKFLLQMFILYPNGLIISKRNLMSTNSNGQEHAITEFYEDMYKISQQPPIPRLSIARLVARKSIETYHKQVSVGSPQYPESNYEDNIYANPSTSTAPTATLCGASTQAKKISKRRCTIAIGQDDESGRSISPLAAKNNKSSSNNKKIKQSWVVDHDSSSNQSSEFNIPLAHAMRIKKRMRALSSDPNETCPLNSAQPLPFTDGVYSKCKRLKTDDDSTSNGEESGLDVEYFSYYGIKPETIDLSKIYTKVAIGGINTPLTVDKFRHLFNIDCKLRLTKCDVSNMPSYTQYKHIKKACPASHKLKYS